MKTKDDFFSDRDWQEYLEDQEKELNAEQKEQEEEALEISKFVAESRKKRVSTVPKNKQTIINKIKTKIKGDN